jgi:MFS transporter, SP family, arabinose:H+ symporter
VNRQIILWSITSALAGLLFGFDTVVISGAEQQIQTLWHLSSGIHGVAIASALYGTVLGALVGGYLSDRFGRRSTLLLIGLLYFIGAIWSALASNIYGFIAARTLGGLGIGISTVAAPLYIAEIAPPSYRGRLAGMFQFNVVFGILVAYLSNAILSGHGEYAWRWMLGVAAVPSLIYTLLCLGLPESPRWLIARNGDIAGAKRVLRLINPQGTERGILEQANIIRAAVSDQSVSNGFWRRALRRPILLAVLLACFNQLSGINAVLYYAPRIFELAGLGRSAAMLQSVGIGLTNLVFTLVGLWLIDRTGRRTLLFIGSFGYIASLGLIAWAFLAEHFALVPLWIFAFVAAHAVGQGTVIWIYLSEIFPNRQRAQGQALGCTTHWIFAALLTSLFPKVVGIFAPGYVFLFFALMMVLQLIWVKTMVIETKGVPLEQIRARLQVA